MASSLSKHSTRNGWKPGDILFFDTGDSFLVEKIGKKRITLVWLTAPPAYLEDGYPELTVVKPSNRLLQRFKKGKKVKKEKLDTLVIDFDVDAEVWWDAELWCEENEVSVGDQLTKYNTDYEVEEIGYDYVVLKPLDSLLVHRILVVDAEGAESWLGGGISL